MVVAQAGRVGQRGVRGHLLAVVRTLLVERSRGPFGRAVRSGVEGVAVHGLPAVGLVEVEADVDVAHQYVLYQVEVHRRAVVHVELAVLAPRVALDESGPARVDGRFGPGAVGIGDQRDGECLVVEHAVDVHRRGRDVGVGRRLVRIAVHEVGRVLDAQPRFHPDVAFGLDVELLVLLVSGVVDAVLLEDTSRDVVGGRFAAACHAQVVLVAGRVVAVEHVVPVRVAEIFVGVLVVDAPFLERRVAVAAGQLVVPRAVELEDIVDVGRVRAVGVGVGFEEGGGEVVAVGDHLRRRGPFVEGVRAVVGHLRAAFLGRFGRHQDYAERTPRAIDGRRGGVLEYGDRLDVVGVHGGHVGFDAIYQHERRTAGSDRVFRAADADRGGTVGLAVGEGHRQARDGALKRPRNTHRRTVPLLERLGREGLDRTYDVAAFLEAVSDHHHLFEAGVVLLERDVDAGLSVHPERLLFIPDITEVQGFSRRGFDRVAAVGIGGRAAGRARYDHRDAENGLSVRVFHDARHGPPPSVLCPDGQREESEEQCQREVPDARAVLLRGVRAGRVALFHCTACLVINRFSPFRRYTLLYIRSVDRTAVQVVSDYILWEEGC